MEKEKRKYIFDMMYDYNGWKSETLRKLGEK